MRSLSCPSVRALIRATVSEPLGAGAGAPKPYTPRGFVPIDLNEDNISVLIDGEPLLVTNVKKITLGYHHKRRKIVEGRMAADREVKKALRSLKERHKKKDIRHKAVKLIVTSALRKRKAVVLKVPKK
ncbi:MAG: hypothetical protein TU35_010000 [Thermoproteus sp. AZ2]|uniref:Uncharacterized protein n=1 Tax=Thermoproteus sp. AZ2 TaxID=1609232 RepID=A0ACC6V3J8_9CREN